MRHTVRFAAFKGKHDVARETDFLDLYRLLGLEPGCGLDEFKQAYRRRVSVLHPDRRDEDSRSIAAQRLQQLTAMYGMAMEFHRTHGRLPGAAGVRPPSPAAGKAGPAPATQRVRATRRHSRRWWLLPAAAIAAWWLWPTVPSAPPPAETGPASTRHAATMPAPRPAWGLGTDAASVLGIEGEPTLKAGDQRWEYGPSWVRFENGKVVDWYSSPLYPLHVAAHGDAPQGR